MAYANSTKPSGSFSNTSKPTTGGSITWATLTYTYASYIYAWNAVLEYTNSSKPSGSFSNSSKP